MLNQIFLILVSLSLTHKVYECSGYEWLWGEWGRHGTDEPIPGDLLGHTTPDIKWGLQSHLSGVRGQPLTTNNHLCFSAPGADSSIQPMMQCACAAQVGMATGHTSCIGDSGGPLVCQNDTDMSCYQVRANRWDCQFSPLSLWPSWKMGDGEHLEA